MFVHMCLLPSQRTLLGNKQAELFLPLHFMHAQAIVYCTDTCCATVYMYVRQFCSLQFVEILPQTCIHNSAG